MADEFEDEPITRRRVRRKSRIKAEKRLETASVARVSENPLPDENIVFSVPGSSSSKPTPQKKRRFWLIFSFLIFVLVPIGLGSYYYVEIASNRYVSGAGFAVRGVNSGGGLDGIAALTGLASTGSTTSDSYIILKYLKSRDILEKLQSDMKMREAFSYDYIDFWSRMDPKLKIEDFVDYWEGKIETSFDSGSGVLTYEIQAFTPDDSKQMADLVLTYIQDLVNRLSKSAREDSVRFAVTEVKLAEERLRKELQRLRDFRETERSINPAKNAQLDAELINVIKRQLIDVQTRIATIEGSVDANAPSMVSLRRQAVALELQITERTKKIGITAGGSGDEISSLLAKFEALEVEREFAQKAYASTLSSLEQARTEADRQQRYLAIYSLPSMPEQALYPQRIINIAMLIAVIFAIWSILTLVVYSVRDHLS